MIDVPVVIDSNLSGLIVELIQLRSDLRSSSHSLVESFWNNESFNDLPTFTKREIAGLSRSVQLDPLYYSLLIMGFPPIYSIEQVEQFVNSGDSSDLQNFIILYQLLACFREQRVQRQANVLIKVLKKIIGTKFERYGNVLFYHFSIVLINDAAFCIDESMFEQLMNYIRHSRLIDHTFMPYYCGFLRKIFKSGDENLSLKCLSVTRELLDKTKCLLMETKDFTLLITTIMQYITDMNVDAVYILCKCAERPYASQIIKETFAKFPKLLFDKFCKSEVRFARDGFNSVYEIEKLMERRCDSEMTMPGIDLVETREYPQFEIADCLTALATIPEHYRDAVFACIEEISDEIAASEHYIDFYSVLVELVIVLGNKYSINGIFELFYNEIAFESKNTIFSINKLTEAQNAIRNRAFKLFMLNRDAMNRVFTVASVNPAMIAEHLTRLYFIFSDNIVNIFDNDIALAALIGTTSVIRQTLFPGYYDRLDLAESITFSVVFDLMSDSASALRCLSCQVFSIGFMSLIFEPSLSNLVITSITKCIGDFDTLPKPVSAFLIMFFESCATNLPFAEIGRPLSRAIINAIARNRVMATQFEPIFDSSLKYMCNDADPGSFDDVLSLLMLMTHSDLTFKFTPLRFNRILDMIERVEGYEPSDRTLEKMVNLINCSTILTLVPQDLDEVMIKVSQFIPIMLIAFRKSKRLERVVSIFTQICRNSVSNAIQCHEGRLSLILLKALRGEFTFMGRNIEFELNCPTKDIFELISTIVLNASDYEVNMAFIDLINAGNEEAQRSLAAIISSLDHEPSPAYPIFQMEPIIKTVNTPWKGTVATEDGFSFTFYVKVDTRKVYPLNAQFVIMQMTSSHRKAMLAIYMARRSIFLQYESDGKRSISQIVPAIPTNQWMLVSIRCQASPTDPTIFARYGGHEYHIWENRNFELGDKVNIEFCKTLEENVDSRLVLMGPFAFHSGVFEDEELDDLMKNGLSYFNTVKKPALAVSSPSMIVSKPLKTKSGNIYATMKKHLRVQDLLPVFRHASRYSQSFIEGVVSFLSFCAKREKGMELFSYDGVYHNMRYSDLSHALWLIYTNSPEKFTSTLYSTILNMYRTVPTREVFDNILFNFSLWSENEAVLYKIMRILTANVEAIYCERMFMYVLWETTQLPDNNTSIFRLLEILCNLQITENDVKLLFGVIHETEDESKLLLYISCLNVLFANKSVSVDESLMFMLLKFSTMSQSVFDHLCDLFASHRKMLMHITVKALMNTDFRVIPGNAFLDVLNRLIRDVHDGQTPSFDPSEDCWYIYAVLYALKYEDINVVRMLAMNLTEDILHFVWLMEGLDYEGARWVRGELIREALEYNADITVTLFMMIFFAFSERTNPTFEKPTLTKWSIDDFLHKMDCQNVQKLRLVYSPLQNYRDLLTMISVAPIPLMKPFLSKQEFSTANPLFEHLTVEHVPKVMNAIQSFLQVARNALCAPVEAKLSAYVKRQDGLMKARTEAFLKKGRDREARKGEEFDHKRTIVGLSIQQQKLGKNMSKKNFQCTIRNKYEQCSSILIFEHQEIYLLVEEHNEIIIPFSSVTCISLIRELEIEIFVGGCSSWLIKLSDKDRSAVSIMQQCHLPILDPVQMKSRIEKKWISRKISVCEFLIAANILAGKSLNDPENSMVFPLVADNYQSLRCFHVTDSFTELMCKWSDKRDRAGFNDMLLEAENCESLLPPEFYFTAEYFANQDTCFEDVYKASKFLDQQDVQSFIETNLGLKFKERPALKQPVFDLPVQLKRRPFPFTVPTLRTVHYNDKCNSYIFIDDGNVFKVQKAKNPLITRNLNSDFLISITEKCVLIYDSQTATLVTVSLYPRIAITSTAFHLFVTNIVAVSCTKMLFVMNHHLIYFWDFVNSSLLVAKSRSAVASLLYNSTHRVAAFSTEDFTISTVFLPSMDSFSFSLDAPVDKLILTKKRGFVIAHSDKKLYIFTSTMRLIKTVKFDKVIRFWETLCISDIDYVIALDEHRVVLSFESFYPENSSIVTKIPDETILGVSFAASTNSLLFFTGSGAFTHPFVPQFTKSRNE